MLAGLEATGATRRDGARVGRGRTTLYMRTRLDSRVVLPVGAGGPAGPTTGNVMAEFTLEGGEPRELAFRAVGHGAGGGRVADTVARLDLRDPANRAAPAAAARPRPWPPSLLRLAVRVAGWSSARSTTSATTRGSFALGVRLGAELGVETADVRVQTAARRRQRLDARLARTRARGLPAVTAGPRERTS